MDLFEFEPEGIVLPGAELTYYPRFDLGLSPEVCLEELVSETPWGQNTIVLWGKRYKEPRLSAWYGDPGASYRYSGIDLQPLPWTPRLLDLRRRVEAVAGVSFNSVLLNYYRDGADSMGLHADDEPELGPNPVIASLSLGERRTFLLKHKRRKDLDTVRLPLDSGSLLLMRGETQSNWKHGINKARRALGPRVNLTFRAIVSPAAGEPRGQG